MTKKHLWMAVLAVLLVALCAPAFAATPSSGKVGTASFELTAGGTLTVHDGSFPEQFVPGENEEWNARDQEGVTKLIYRNVTIPFNLVDFQYSYSNLEEADFSNVDMPNATSIEIMFGKFTKLKTVKFTNVNAPKALSLQGMFNHCTSLTTVDISGLNVPSATDMSNMFVGCTALETIVWGGNFDVSNVKEMTAMFEGCTQLGELDLSTFNTTNVTGMTRMFQDCSSLVTIKVGESWDVSKVNDNGANMFLGCTSIKGASGTGYDENNVDVSMARPDGGTASPGYLTGPKENPLITAPTPKTGLVYKGLDVRQVLVNPGQVKGGTMLYTIYGDIEESWVIDLPEGTIGTFTVWWKVEGNAQYSDVAPASFDVTIEKCDSEPTVTAIQDLTYNGMEQQIVTVKWDGPTNPAPVIWYSLNGGEAFTEVPPATDAGKYTLSYECKGNDVYKAFGPKTVEAEIKKADFFFREPEPQNLTYNGEPQYLVTAGEIDPAEMGKVWYDVDGGPSSAYVPTGQNAGKYIVGYGVDAIDEKNFNSIGRHTVAVTINKAVPRYTAPKPRSLTFTGAAQQLADEGSSEAGTTMLYKLKDGTSWDVTVPTGTNAGLYTLGYYVQGNANYRDQPVRSIDITIQQAESLGAAPTGKTLDYTGAAQELVTPGSALNGLTMQYSVNGGAYSTAVPTATEAGAYVVGYRIDGGVNYKTVTGTVTSKIVKAEEVKENAEEAAKKVEDSSLNGTEAGNALTEALKSDNLDTQAAATDVVKALDKSYSDAELETLNLSKEDMNKAINNKKQEAEDKAKEDANKVVEDTKVPAATDLLADSSNTALKDANEDLTVQPKLVEPKAAVESKDEIAATLGVSVETDISIDPVEKELTKQAETVEELFNKVSADLASAANDTTGKGVVIATVFPRMTANATGFFPLKVNLRNLMPGRRLKFWPSVSYFQQKVQGKASVAGVGLAGAEGDFYFLDENGNKVESVTGDASKMTVVPFLTAGSYPDAFITADATSADQEPLKKLAEAAGSGGTDAPTSDKDGGGCDAGLGFAGVVALTVALLKKKSLSA